MAQITNGSVTFRRVLKVTEYEPKEAIARLDFAAAEGEDITEVFNTAGRMAQAKVGELLGVVSHGPATKEAVGTGVDSNAAKAAFAESQKPAAKPLGKPPGKKKTEEKPAISTGETRTAPGEEVDEFDEPLPKSGTGSSEKVDASETNEWDEVAETKVVEITDKELMSACARKNAETKSSTPIRALVAEFAGPIPKGTKDILQAKRQEFLDKLKALTA